MDRSTWQVEHDFVFRNPSSTVVADLYLASRSCGCTKCVIHRPKVAPGKETRITLAYDLRFRRGVRREDVVITTGLAEIPQLLLRLEAEAYPRLRMVPDLPLRATVIPGRFRTVEATFVAYEPCDEKQVPFQVECQGNGLSVLSVNSGPTEVLDTVRQSSVTCVFRLACPGIDEEAFGGGEYSGRVDVRHGCQHLQKEIAWCAKQFISLSPQQVLLRGRTSEPDEVKVKLTAELPFSITTVEMDGDLVECVPSSSVRQCEHSLVVRLKALSEQRLAKTCKVWIHLDHPQQGIAKIPVFVLW